MIIRPLAEANCRYLGEPGVTVSHFHSLLGNLNLRLPGDLTLETLALRGWLEPVLRVKMPEDFFLQWKGFPSIRPMDEVPEEFRWPAALWDVCVYMVPQPAGEPRNLSGRWFTHLLDEDTHPLRRWINDNRLDPKEKPPDRLKHPGRSQPIQTWVDFYAYWQAYQLAELLPAMVLHPAIYVGSNEESKVKSILDKLDQHKEIAELKVEHCTSRWSKPQEVFEWVSRYRTLVGIWSTTLAGFPDGSGEAMTAGASALSRELNLDADELKLAIRNELLVLWRHWERPGVPGAWLSPVHRMLQQDIVRACEFLRSLTGQMIDPDDPIWREPEDGSPTNWTPLLRALPYEDLVAREDLAMYAMMYLDDFLAMISKRKRFTEEQLRVKIKKWWGMSAPFRRMAVAFVRLHEHHGSRVNKDNLVGLRHETPVEFLNLSALHVERLIKERLEARGHSSPKDFHPQIIEVGKLVGKKYGVAKVGQLSEALKPLLEDRASLHSLPANPRYPFVEDEEIRDEFSDLDGRSRCLLRLLVNLAIMRNYAAHHDCIDRELIDEGWAGPGAEAIAAVAIMVMETLA